MIFKHSQSPHAQVNSGLPQGNILGPLLVLTQQNLFIFKLIFCLFSYLCDSQNIHSSCQIPRQTPGNNRSEITETPLVIIFLHSNIVLRNRRLGFRKQSTNQRRIVDCETSQSPRESDQDRNCGFAQKEFRLARALRQLLEIFYRCCQIQQAFHLHCYYFFSGFLASRRYVA